MTEVHHRHRNQSGISRPDIESARSFLLGRSRDFVEVCNLAGLDPSAVYERGATRVKAAMAGDHIQPQKVLVR